MVRCRLLDGSVAFGGEESAGASFSRRTARSGRPQGRDRSARSPRNHSARRTDPTQCYQALADQLGHPWRIGRSTRLGGAALSLAKLSAGELHMTQLAASVQGIYDRAPGNDAPIGGARSFAAHGWFAARLRHRSIYKIYAESFRGSEPLGHPQQARRLSMRHRGPHE